MKNKTIFAMIAFSMIAVLGISSIVVAQGGFGFGMDDEDRAAMQTQHEAMQDAIANNDFAAWKALHEQRITQNSAMLTEENFNQAVERHANMEEFRTAMQEAKISGDYSKVEQLKEQYGFGTGKGAGKGIGHRGMGGAGCPLAQ